MQLPIKRTGGKQWSTAPEQWARYQEPMFIPLYQEALQAIRLDEEKMLLDAGCGSGLFLSMAAPTGALLHGVDAAPEMIALARARVPGASLLVEDHQALPFIDGSFDVITGFNSFQYALTADAALREARRVVKRHGQVVIGIWGHEEDCDANLLFRAIAALLPPAHPDAPGPFALSEAGKVESICKEIGLRIMHQKTVFCPWTFNSDSELQEALLCTAPSARAVEICGEATVRHAMLTAAQPFSLADDVYYLKNTFTLFITQKV